MKILCLFALGAVVTAFPVAGQSSKLLADAARQELEDKVRRQQAEIEDLKLLVNSLAENLKTLNQQVVDQNRAMTKFAEAYKISLEDYARKDDLGGIARSVKEVESNREADKKLFLNKFDELRKLILDNPTKVIQVNTGGGSSSRPREEPRGVEHQVAPGETASAIVEAYNAELKKRGSKARVTFDLLKQANPGLNLDRIYVGQKLFIPIVD